MRTRRALAAIALAATVGGIGMRQAVGANPWEVPGDGLGDGYTGAIVDPVTGAKLFEPNLDPAVSGIDPLTGTAYPTGTDLSFGAAIRRQQQTNVINGDFAVLPPGGAGSAIDSDPASATHNPLPGWTWTPVADGLGVATIAASAVTASGYAFQYTDNGGSAGSRLSQMVSVPRTFGQQYRAMLSVIADVTFGGIYRLVYQFYKADATTAIGSEVASGYAGTPVELKLDAGLVPPTASMVKVIIEPSGVTAGDTVSIYEVRVAFLPAEASLGLASITANNAITNSEERVVGITVPANSLVAGSVYRFRAFGTITNAGAADTATFRIRIGTTTLTGAIAATNSPTVNATASSDGFAVDGMLTVRSVGATGSAIAHFVINGSAEPFAARNYTSSATGTVTVDTTVANVLELTIVTGHANLTVTARQGVIECVMAS